MSELAQKPHAQRVLMHSLSEQDIGQCMAHAAGTDLPARLVTTVYDQTEGNPFFVTEIIRLLVAEG